MNQTAVEWLFHKLWETSKDKFSWHSILEQAIEMEKQQIIDAWEDGQGSFSTRTVEQYHNETYKQ
jgi:hypothetical protein